jgi:hypothetical protein
MSKRWRMFPSYGRGSRAQEEVSCKAFRKKAVKLA